MSELNIRVVANQMGISAATLSRVERGEGVDGETLARILKWLLSGSHTESFGHNVVHKSGIRGRIGQRNINNIASSNKREMDEIG